MDPHYYNTSVIYIFICLQIAHKYLVEKNLSPADETQFKEQLYRIWFELYARRGSSRWVGSGAVPKYDFTSKIWHHDGNHTTQRKWLLEPAAKYQYNIMWSS